MRQGRYLPLPNPLHFVRHRNPGCSSPVLAHRLRQENSPLVLSQSEEKKGHIHEIMRFLVWYDFKDTPMPSPCLAQRQTILVTRKRLLIKRKSSSCASCFRSFCDYPKPQSISI